LGQGAETPATQLPPGQVAAVVSVELTHVGIAPAHVSHAAPVVPHAVAESPLVQVPAPASGRSQQPPWHGSPAAHVVEHTWVASEQASPSGHSLADVHPASYVPVSGPESCVVMAASVGSDESTSPSEETGASTAPSVGGATSSLEASIVASKPASIVASESPILSAPTSGTDESSAPSSGGSAAS
jgi:hypothetical protein